MRNQQLTLELTETIKDSIRKFDDLKKATETSLVALANSARETGIFLIEYKENASRQDWFEFSTSLTANASEIENFIKIAHKYPQKIESLAEIRFSQLLLEGVEKNDDRSHKIDVNAVTECTKILMNAKGNMISMLKKVNIESLSETQRASIKTQIDWFESYLIAFKAKLGFEIINR